MVVIKRVLEAVITLKLEWVGLELVMEFKWILISTDYFLDEEYLGDVAYLKKLKRTLEVRYVAFRNNL